MIEIQVHCHASRSHRLSTSCTHLDNLRKDRAGQHTRFRQKWGQLTPMVHSRASRVPGEVLRTVSPGVGTVMIVKQTFGLVSKGFNLQKPRATYTSQNGVFTERVR